MKNNRIYWSILQDALNFSAPNVKVFVVKVKKPCKWWEFWKWKKTYEDGCMAKEIERLLNWAIKQPGIIEKISDTEKY